MRIAVYHSLPPGGARRLVSEIIRRSSADHAYDLYTLDLAETPNGAAGAELNGHLNAAHRAMLPRPAMGRLTAATPLRIPGIVSRIHAAEREIAARIDAGGYELCWVHHTEYVQAPFLLRHLRTPSLYYVHEPRRQSFEARAYRSPYVHRSAPRRALARSFEEYLRRADAVSTAAATHLACNSHFTAEAIERAYGRDAWVCHPGVDESLFAPSEVPAAHTTNTPYVIAVGALHWLKGHELAIDAVARVAAPRPELVVVYGRSVPDCESRLRERAARSGVSLHLRRDVPDAELVALYRGAVATVCASRLEPFGLTALESASCGTPVVAVAEGGFRETVVDGAGGRLVEASAEGIAEGIETVRRDAPRHDPVATRATVVPRFSWDATVARLHELYERTVAVAPR